MVLRTTVANKRVIDDADFRKKSRERSQKKSKNIVVQGDTAPPAREVETRQTSKGVRRVRDA
jgi:hypothetical protein